jgi:glycosyltransferase involved in cell wall biosynthesis
MKIVQAISHYVPAYRFGGPLQVAHALGRELVARGHEVSVCCTNQRDQAGDLDVPVDLPVVVDGVRVYYEPVPRFRRWGYSPRLDRRAGEVIAAADAVLVHAHFQYAGWAGARAARRFGKPYLVFAHGSLKKASLRASSGFAKRVYLALFERANLQQARHVAFNAEEEMEDSLFVGRGVVLPNGIAPADFTLLPRRGAYRERHLEWGGRTVYLFLGRIDIRQKAVDVIVGAFAQLAAEAPDALLVLAGPSEGGDAELVRTMVAERGLGGRVLFPGLVSGRDKLELLRDADVFLMPSRYEGLSIALLEAMASELPVILSDRAGLHRQVARHGCGVVVGPEIASTAAAMRQMLDCGIRSRCGAAGRKLVMAEHTWPVIAAKLETLLLPS